jgi:hypothetical protein
MPTAIGDVLGFLAATGRMSKRAAMSLTRRAERNTAPFVEAMEDGERHGPTGAILAAMLGDGVEIGDAEAMQAWLGAFNESPYDERDAVLGPAIERSLPPPSRAQE